MRIELLDGSGGAIIATREFAAAQFGKEGVGWRVSEVQDADPIQAPQTVTRRQARKALVLAGLFDLVQPAIDAIADPLERQLAQIDWDDSQEFARDWPLLLSIGQGLGLDAEDMDQLFIEAASH